MKLSDIVLTTAQAAEFVAFLQERIEKRERAAAKAAEEAEQAQVNEGYHEKLAELARDTARQSGPVVGVRDYDLARASWDAFIACEGWYSPYDVAECWDRDDSEFAEAWGHAYVGELETMRRERKQQSAA